MTDIASEEFLKVIAKAKADKDWDLIYRPSRILPIWG